MKLVDDEDVETMIARLLTWSSRTVYGGSNIVRVDGESTIRGIDIDLNVTPDIDVVGDDGYDSNDPCDQEVDSDSDPDVEDVPDDIDDENVNDDGNINASSVGNQMRSIMIHNNPGPHMSLIDPNTVYAAEFPEYPKILPAHRLAVSSKPKELFVGHKFESKEEYELHLFKIRRCGRYVNLLGLTHAHQHVWQWSNCMGISILIAEMQARFQYRVSYRKAWIAKQMAMEQFYGDFDASYNELQGWIAAMREYVPRTIIELQTRPYYGPDDQLQSGKRIFHQMF
ncbi:hypothetical protein GOBAR_AA10954 [Gossypium barbadense]|uniref:Transposase MuDR plant domain-containing protein n=1 Tax=Gossypium barbadense TaxID=3634 RepID=A0A2P5Y297_GOSBA|nr:hypothetical protein GOBAR_AA10954 [Gossypium barbadense]